MQRTWKKEEEERVEPEAIQETPGKTIRALLAIVVLTESKKISRVVTSEDIQHAVFTGTVVTEKEKIVNFLRPFIQQRTIDNKLPETHILTRASLAALANAIVAPHPFITLQQDPRSLQLAYTTRLVGIGIFQNKLATLGVFFDMNCGDSLMDSCGLQFALRQFFINEWTVRLLGGLRLEKLLLCQTIIRKQNQDRALSSCQKVAFSETDPGTVVASVTVPRTLESIFASINRFQVLADDGAPHALDVAHLPKPHKNTVGLVNNITFFEEAAQKAAGETKARYR